MWVTGLIEFPLISNTLVLFILAALYSVFVGFTVSPLEAGRIGRRELGEASCCSVPALPVFLRRLVRIKCEGLLK